jgi:hypothetical protein
MIILAQELFQLFGFSLACWYFLPNKTEDAANNVQTETAIEA